MSNLTSAIRAALILARVSATLLPILLLSSAAAAQSNTAVDGYTPLALSSGSPSGAYNVSGFENVNLFNGNLNFALPLLGVDGRGGMTHQLMRPLGRKWVVERFYDEFTQVYSYFPYEDWEQWNDPGYGPGRLTARYAAWGSKNCIRPGNVTEKLYTQTLTRLTFSVPGGTQYELRDLQSDGARYIVPGCPTTSYSRGTTFITADGTSATFISDTAVTDALIVGEADWMGDIINLSGYLILRDGTRYRIDDGNVTWLRDRNGNRLSFTYNGGGHPATITDSLNRQVTLTYSSTGVPYDEIKFKGSGGVQRTLRVNYASLGSALGSGYSLQTPKQLFPELDGSSTTSYNPTVIRSVTLPDGRSFTFSYNSYAELSRVVLPTGGAIEYDYAAGLTSGNASGAVNFGSAFGGGFDWQIYRRVIERRTYTNGTTLEGKTTYSRPESDAETTLGYVVADQKSATGALIARQKHYFYGSAAGSLNNTGAAPALSYPGWKEGREWKTEALDDDGTTVLRRVEHTWQQPVAGSTWPLTQAETNDGAKPNNPQITQTVTTLVDANQVAKQTFTYDQYNNRTDVYEYNYGTGAAGSLVRRTDTDFLTTNVIGGVTHDYVSDTSIHLRNLPEQISIYDAAGVEQARTTFEYDNYTATANHAALVARTGISGLDAAFTAAKKTRGNATGVTSYLLTNGAVTSSISTYQQFDVAGNVVKVIDGRGYQTSFNFSDRFGAPDTEARLNSGSLELGTQAAYAFPGLVTNHLGHTFYTQRDYYTGLVVNAEDSNGVTSSAYYEDALDRPTQVIRAADDTDLHTQTSFSYDDINRVITTTSDRSAFNDNLLKGQALYDGLGRTTETRRYEDATAYVTVKKTYDALGRISKLSNPYRAGQTVVWTTTTYDALSRVISVKTPDNAIATTAHSGNTVTVTDQSGKDRQSVTDSLGRLSQVIEDPGGLGYLTTYSYDVLNNLRTVTQSGQQNGQQVTQTRTFTYDSLSRLKSAAAPETGNISYSYDNNGNLTQKTDARSITTNISYDALNRPTLKDYSDATPDVRYFYDAQTLPAGAPTFTRGASTGRLVAVTTGGTNAGSYYGYDGLGQTLRRIQRTDSLNYLAEAAYNKAGVIATETYPALPGVSDRRVVSYSFDEAGRHSSLLSEETTYAPNAEVSATSITYAPHGGLASETLGNSLKHALVYNSRLQPTQIKLGTTAAPTSVLNLTYNYGTTNNNGNVLDVTHRIGTWTSKQLYTYDSLNRLGSTSETNGSTTTYWTEDNSYDRFGNRSEVVAGVPTLTFNSSNQISSYTYDAAGNMTSDLPGKTYVYDAENRIKTVNGVANSFVYDGEGKRVKKNFPLGEKVRFVYGVGGQLLMEFDTTSGALKKEYIYGVGGLLATIDATNGAQYMTPDHLGSPRVVTGDTGAVVSRHDYRPFGKELIVGESGRTAAHGFGAEDGIRQQFTQHQRDAEIGLDYYGARYYDGAQGRFTSCDPAMISQRHVINPQRWNLYVYVINNPLSLYDPDGQSDKGEGGAKVIDVFLAYEGSEQDVERVRQEITEQMAAMTYGTPDPLVTVNVYGYKDSTVDNVLKSAQTPGRTTIVVAHAFSEDEGITKEKNGGDPGDLFPGESIKLYDGFIGRRGILRDGSSKWEDFKLHGENFIFLGCRLTPRAVASFTARMTSSTALFTYGDGGRDGLTQLGVNIELAVIAAASLGSGKTMLETRALLQARVNLYNSRMGPRRGLFDRIWVKPGVENKIDFNPNKLYPRRK